MEWMDECIDAMNWLHACVVDDCGHTDGWVLGEEGGGADQCKDELNVEVNEHIDHLKNSGSMGDQRDVSGVTVTWEQESLPPTHLDRPRKQDQANG